MIKGILESGAIVLALEHGNIDRLREGDPIVIDLAELGHPGAGLLLVTHMSNENRYAMPADPAVCDKIERVVALRDSAILAITRLPVGDYTSQDMMESKSD